MKKINGEFWRKCQFPFLIMCATMPIVMYTMGALTPAWMYFGWILGGVYALFTAAALLVTAKRRILCALLGCLVEIGLGFGVYTAGDHWALLLPPLFYCVLLLWSLRLCTWSWTEELPTSWYWTGFVIHAAAQVLYSVNQINTASMEAAKGRDLVALFESARPGTLIAFFGFILLAMLSMNRDSMVSAGMGRQKTSASMNRKNTVFVAAFFVVAIIIALIPAISEAVTAAWNWLISTIGRLLNALVQSLPIEGTLSNGGSNDQMMGGMSGEASPFALLMQKIFMVLGTVLNAVVVLGILYALGKTIWKHLLNLMHSLSKYMSSVSEDYEDEITDTRDFGEKERVRISRRSRRAAVAESKNMPAGERIRRRYLRLLYKHPEWGRGTTARENLPPEAAPLYERARYSDHPLTDGDAERFSAGIKGL